MAYNISGETNSNSRIIVINESDWTVEATTENINSTFEIADLVSGTKTIIARENSTGYIIGYGGVIPYESVPE